MVKGAIDAHSIEDNKSLPMKLSAQKVVALGRVELRDALP